MTRPRADLKVRPYVEARVGADLKVRPYVDV